MDHFKEIEKSIIKKFKKDIWVKFVHALKEYELINDGDKIMVCISGGKDSFLMSKCMEEIKKHKKVNFDYINVLMNPGYKKDHLDLIDHNSKKLNIPLEIFESPIFDIVDNQTEGSPCYLCAKMRRGYLYAKAKELGCNKIALGHHFDDVIETVLLSIFYTGEYKTMMPKLKSTNFEGLELIRPMYLIKESNIIKWSLYNNLKFLNCACMFTEKISVSEESQSKRLEMKELIYELNKKNPLIEKNIFKSMYNVHIDAIIGFKKDGVKHNFLDKY